MLRNVSINRKGALLLGLPSAMFVALLVPLLSIGTSLDQAVNENVRLQGLLTRIDAIKSAVVTIHSDNLQLALLGTGVLEVEIIGRAREAAAQLASLKDDLGNAPLPSKDMLMFASEAQVLLERLPATHHLLRDGDVAKGRAAAAQDERDVRSVSNLGSRMHVEVRRQLVHRFTEMNRLSTQGRIVLVSGSIVAIAVVLTIGWLLLRSMLWRLHTIQENVAGLERGRELSPPIKAQDEIGDIDAAVHKMVLSLRAQHAENELFIYSVSHDLRSPLVNLQGFGKELGRATDDLVEMVHAEPGVPPSLAQRIDRLIEEDMREALRFIDLAVQRQARIIESLLSLSRAGRVEYRWQNVDLDDRIGRLAAEMQKHLSGEGAITVQGTLPTVHGDPDALERVFENLLNNAIKYSLPERHPSITIGTVEDDAPDAHTVFVRDNGAGMTAEQAERAFLPFARFAGGEGEGIGLSLVKRVVDRHLGRVWIESEPGVGTTVLVTLPDARPTPLPSQ